MANTLNVTLRDMVEKTRSFLRGSNFNDETQITRSIQRFMDFTLPYSVNLQIFRTTWAFATTPHQPNYTKPKRYITVGNYKIFYVDGYQRYFTSDFDKFKQYYTSDYYPNAETEITTGDGTASYNIPLPSERIQRGVTSPDGNIKPRFFINTILPSGTRANGFDDGLGNIMGDGIAANSTIDYQNGTVNINFTENIDEGTPINAIYSTYTLGVPYAAFFQSDVLELRPYPDRAYVVELDAYVKPSVLLEEDNFLNYEWLFDYITLGAARRIFEELGNTNKLDRTEKTFEEYKAFVNNRSSRQESRSEFIETAFTDSVDNFGYEYFY